MAPGWRGTAGEAQGNAWGILIDYMLRKKYKMATFD